MDYLLPPAEYDQVRQVIDVKLDARQLPDTTITQQVFLGAAQDELVRRYPTAAAATGENLERVRRALVYLTAARLCPAVVRLTTVSVQAQGMSYTRATFDPEERAAALRALAEVELTALQSPTDNTTARPRMFTVASGQRGR